MSKNVRLPYWDLLKLENIFETTKVKERKNSSRSLVSQDLSRDPCRRSCGGRSNRNWSRGELFKNKVHELGTEKDGKEGAKREEKRLWEVSQTGIQGVVKGGRPLTHPKIFGVHSQRYLLRRERFRGTQFRWRPSHGWLRLAHVSRRRP